MPQDRLPGAKTIPKILRLLGKPFHALLTLIIIALITFILLLKRLVFWVQTHLIFHLPQPQFHFPSLHLPSLPHFRQSKIILLLIPLVPLLFFVVIFYFFILKDLPHPQDLLTFHQPITTKIYARDGRLLYKLYQNENRTLVSLSAIPTSVVNATIAIEDAEFYQHVGFSLKGIVRAFFKNAQNDSLQGGSTITQQLVKNTLLTRERTFKRKLKELVLSLQIENYFTKDEILSMYLNQVPFGGTAYGIEEAAQLYFNKSVTEVNLAEAALLAGLPVAPTIYSPFGANPELAISRQHEVLNRMVQEGYIDRQTAEDAKNTPLEFARPGNNLKAPHFVMYVKDLLAKKYGDSTVNQGGLEVTTSLDLDIQELAETVVNEELAKLAKMNVQNAAVIVAKPRTGEILAMVGSKNYYDTENDGQVNVTLRPRQPGSSIKVITYTLALENRFTPSTLITDSPVTYKLPGSPPYSPKNYDGVYHGSVTLRTALANSYNIPAVKILSELGVTNMIQKAQSMGITTWDDPSRYGLSLTLGGGEIKMIDMVTVYGTLANYGLKIEPHPILNVSDYAHINDEVSPCRQASTCQGEVVVNPQVAYLITDILADNNARAPAFGTHSQLQIPGQAVAVKTGTTNNLRDNWTFGYTPDFLVAVWVGNNDNTPMSRVASGITGASPIFNRIMAALLATNPHPQFQPPEGLVSVTICPLTGTKTCAACPNPKNEFFLPGTEPSMSCNDDQINLLLNPSPGSTPPPDRNRILDGATTQLPTPIPQPSFSFKLSLPGTLKIKPPPNRQSH